MQDHQRVAVQCACPDRRGSTAVRREVRESAKNACSCTVLWRERRARLDPRVHLLERTSSEGFKCLKETSSIYAPIARRERCYCDSMTSRTSLFSSLLLIAVATSSDAAAQSAADAPSSADGPRFLEEAATRGLHFTHRNGMTGALYMPETVGSGGALLDYDGDGDLDVYLVQGGDFVPGDVGGGEGRLFRNLLREEGELRFVEVKTSGLDARGYGMGAATGDFDNDGRVDLFLAN